MAYDYQVPNESNLVRGVSGDLVAIQGNFEHLKPVADYLLTSGASPNAALRGFVFGDDLDASRFRLLVSGGSGGELRVQANDGGWFDLFAFSQSGLDARAYHPISGQTPTAAQHLTTRGYVLGLSLDDHADVDAAGAVSGDVLRFNGTDWVDGRTQLAQLSDTALVSPASGEVLAYNGTQWVNSGLSIVVDHGSLTGLLDDDHPQYPLISATEVIEGPWTFDVAGGSRKLTVSGSEQAVGAYQLILVGRRAGYGAGLSFQAELAETPFTQTEMARITADGDAAWNSASGNQLASLRFSTVQSGVLIERMRINYDGSITASGFSGPVSGYTPVNANHLATKAYVDTLSGLSISGATTLSGLTDTYDGSMVTPASGEALVWDGSLWVPSGITGAGGGSSILEVQMFS